MSGEDTTFSLTALAEALPAPGTSSNQAHHEHNTHASRSLPFSPTSGISRYNPYTNAPPVKKGTVAGEPLYGFLPRNVNAAQVTKAMVCTCAGADMQ